MQRKPSFCQRALAAIAVSAGLMLAAVASAPASGVAAPGHRVVTAWPYAPPYGSFAESMALGRDGRLYASVTTWGDKNDRGRVVRISPDTGRRHPVGPVINAGQGLLTGVAFDGQGRLYVGLATFSDDPAPGVLRIGPGGKVTRVASLPAESFPNGLAFLGGRLYVTDASLGAVWQIDPAQHAGLTTPWLTDVRLAPVKDLGANGIAAWKGRLYVGVSDAGRIVRIGIAHDGSPASVQTVIRRRLLVTADGMAFGAGGSLWITTNGPGPGRLLRLTPEGRLAVVVDRTAWLDYPTQPVLGSTPGTAGSVFVENGSFTHGSPSIVALPLGVRGVLP